MARDNKNAGLVIKRHNIRIWCHDCDMARLQRVVWEGHGSRLLSEVSSQPVVKKFLEAVPYIMNTIRDIHTSVVQNDLEGLMKHAGDPVPPQALSSRDANNMTVMHKAAGLGHGGILKYIAERYPQGINDVDNDGRTPLHYAAAMRDDQHTYNTLVGLGADESVVDNKNKTPAYYINRPQEIDKNMFKTLPDAPRTPSSAYPTSWDWKLLDTEVIAELNKKSRRRNHKASNENISSKDTNTMTTSESTDNRIGGMKGSSTHELINNLPELDDAKQTKDDIENHIANVESNKETEVVEENHEHEQEEVKEGNAEEAAEEHEEKTNDAEEATEHVKETKEDEGEHPEHSPEETTDHVEETAEKKEVAENNEEVAENNEEFTENNEESTENKEESTENVEKSVAETHQEADNDESNHNEENAEAEAEKDEHHSHEQEAEGEVAEQAVGDEGEYKETPQEPHEEQTKEENEVSEPHDAHHRNENYSGETGEHQSHHIEENDTKENAKNHDIDSIDGGEDDGAASNEGNAKNGEHSEDDDDVQVQGDTQSEYSDSNLKSTAELSDRGSAKRGNVTNGRSTQESLIEGVVNGEAELDSQDASMTQREGSVHGEVLVVDNEIDPEVTDLINNANMEMLATLVLNGEGSRLIGRQSMNSELQAFLDNVPTYMQKINKVHIAAREGNIRDLQAALDRRKFAIARDPISPNGATPLHVATIFGKTNIIKYLGGRFPETLSAVDFEGRTALHYAAVLPDNGHYYNLLQQLGANSKDLDDNGKSAEEYQHHPTLLPYDQLLSEYGISEDAAKSMFSDKGTSHANNGHMDIPMFRTEEGRYLAKSLGDPLIKGLTEVASIKPKDPVAFLASFLHNFPEQEKSNLGTQETEMLVTREAAEVENDQAPRGVAEPVLSSMPLERTRTATKHQRPIDIVTVDPQPVTSPDAPESAFSSATRDEHGQSMLHFAAARTHARNALFQLLQESDISLGFRDELYRTARDVSIQANVPENTVEIDKWMLHMAARGNTDKIMELLMEGYDHILDVVDEEGVPITEVIAQRGDSDMSNLLASIPAFEESRESLHGAVRRGDLPAVQSALSGEGARTLARCQNSFGRTALHVAVLAQHEDVVAHLAQNYPELLRLGDNLERTPLHYAMGVEKIESLSRVLIRAGAKRVLKDLKGRQPTYYFMNKSEILRLKEEEDVY